MQNLESVVWWFLKVRFFVVMQNDSLLTFVQTCEVVDHDPSEDAETRAVPPSGRAIIYPVACHLAIEPQQRGGR